MAGTTVAWLLICLMILGVAGVMLLRSLDGGMRMVERLYAKAPNGRPSRR